MLLLRNLPVHSIKYKGFKTAIFWHQFYATDTVFTSIFPTFASCHLISIFSYIHTYKNSHGKGKFPRINSFILFLEKCYYRNYSSYTQMIKEQYFPLKCYSNIGSPTKKNCNHIIIEFHFPKFYEDSISIFIVFRMRCGGCFLSKLFKSSLIVLTAERSQKLLIENSKFGNNDLFYRNIFHSK